jgi:hypothetical protein
VPAGLRSHSHEVAQRVRHSDRWMLQYSSNPRGGRPSMKKSIWRGAAVGVLTGLVLTFALVSLAYLSRAAPPFDGEWIDGAGFYLMLLGFPLSLVTAVLSDLVPSAELAWLILVVTPLLNLGLIGAAFGSVEKSVPE